MRYRIVVLSKEDPHHERITVEIFGGCLPWWREMPVDSCLGYPIYHAGDIDTARKAIADDRWDRKPWKRQIIEGKP